MKNLVEWSALDRSVTVVSLLVLVALTGCASIAHGPTQQVSISSIPAGATATIVPTGIVLKTPAEVALRRNRVYTIHFELEGHEPQNAYLNRVLSSVFYGNAVFGGAMGRARDLESGAAWELTPESVHVTLEALPDEVEQSPAQGH